MPSMTSYYLQWESVYLQSVFVFVTLCYLRTEHWVQSGSFLMLVARMGTVDEEVNAAPPQHVFNVNDCGNRNMCMEIQSPPLLPPNMLFALTSWGPLLAPYCCNCSSSAAAPADLRARDTWLYWLVWDCPPQASLLILAALPPSQEDNLLWLPSISARPISFPLSLCSVDFHSTSPCCCMTYPILFSQPHPPPCLLSRILFQLFFFL